jgi:hypothetical protein
MTLPIRKKLDTWPSVHLLLRPTNHVTWYGFVGCKAKTDLPRKPSRFEGIHVRISNQTSRVTRTFTIADQFK